MHSVNSPPSPRESDPLINAPISSFSTPHSSMDPDIGQSLHLSDLSSRDPLHPSKSHIIHLLMLCLGFFFVFSPYNTIQNLLSSIIPGRLGIDTTHTSPNFPLTLTVFIDLTSMPGYISLATVYAFFCLGALFISPISVQYFSPRLAMTFGSFTYTLFLASNLKTEYWSMVPAAALLGSIFQIPFL